MDGPAENAGLHGAHSPHASFDVHCARPLLTATFAADMDMLSWAVARPGRQIARRVVWLEVSDKELPPDVDFASLLDARLAEADLGDAVAMMTARDVRRHHRTVARSGDVTAECLATAGLSNAGRVGAVTRKARTGTINLLAAVSTPLSEAALVEAISIASQARTAAVIDCVHAVEGGVATGTGTDCIVVAAPVGGEAEAFAGLHTPVGEALGAAVYEAVYRGAREWLDSRTGT